MNKKKIIFTSTLIMLIVLNLLCMSTYKVFGEENTIKISLSDNEIKVDEKEISKDVAKDIYLSNSMNNGGNSKESLEANIEIKNIININKSGIYEFSGKISDAQISINSNEISGEVIIILNETDITCENAPAILVYNTKTNSDTCKVTIKTQKGTNNTIAGGKIKQSVENWEDQDKILYYIDKGYDDERNYYERYKYDAAISSDISLTFEGEGTLTVNSAKEGIESKRDITINSGNYIINSLDDGINACTDKESIVTINDGTILVNVLDEAEEGDGIDSNGYLYINGGKVYTFASETSQDNGLDSDLGTYINGGTVVSTGNMADEISKESKQKLITLEFANKISKQELITITDEKDNPIVAFKSDRNYKILTISTPNFNEEKYNIYKGGEIGGTSENGLYTNITSYKKGSKQVNNTSETFDISTNNSFRNISDTEQKQIKTEYVILSILIIILAISIILLIKNKSTSKIKEKILMLIIGILIGTIITTTYFTICIKTEDRTNINQNNMQDMREKPDNRKKQNEMPREDMKAPNSDNNQPLQKPSEEQFNIKNI